MGVLMKKHLSSEVSLSLKITISISFILIFILVFFTFMLRWNLTNQKSRILNNSAEKIFQYISLDSDYLNALNEAFLDLPYFIDYSIINTENNEILFTNNIFIPALPYSNKNSVHYVSKNYFIDGNLDVLYKTSKIDDSIYLQVSIDIENDSASKLIYSTPKTIPLLIVPVIILTFLVLLFFIKKDFEKEHNFSANVSHELQTPVNAILGHAKMLQRWGKENPEQTEKSLNIIITEAKSMKSTISNLLELTKLEKKMTEPLKENILIDELFNNLINEFKYEEQLEITKEIINDKDTIPEVISDYELLHQIFLIAISNSLKFCPKPCKIKITCIVEKHNKYIEILDNGNGFSKEILPYIFDRFYRGDKAHSRTKGGAGLGLSIAKSIANVLDIKILAENNSNGGAIIRLIF